MQHDEVISRMVSNSAAKVADGNAEPVDHVMTMQWSRPSDARAHR